MKEYKAYIFDFDGTTFDSGPSMGPVFRAGFEAIGRTCTDEEGLQYMHHSIQWLAEEKHFEDRIQEFVDAIVEAMETPENLAKVAPFPEAEEVIRALKKAGKKTAIVSGNIADHIKLILSLHHMEDCFDAIVGSDMLEKQKPNPDGIFLACKMLGIEPGEETVYIGDSEQDVLAAENAAVDGILVDRLGKDRHLAWTKVKTLKELLS